MYAMQCHAAALRPYAFKFIFCCFSFVGTQDGPAILQVVFAQVGMARMLSHPHAENQVIFLHATAHQKAFT